jgi:hypothetical protein
MDNVYSVVNLGFTFKYFERDYIQVSISTNGYVCLGNNSACSSKIRPSPHDILVGLNYDLNSSRKGSGKIYYKLLDSNSSDFKSSQMYLNLFNSKFEPVNIFMITYDNVLSLRTSSSSRTSFQIFLSTSDSGRNSFVLFKFFSCPADLFLYSLSGLNYKNIVGNLQEVKIVDGQQCRGSNVGQTGVWVSDVTFMGNLRNKVFFCFKQIKKLNLQPKSQRCHFFCQSNE